MENKSHVPNHQPVTVVGRGFYFAFFNRGVPEGSPWRVPLRPFSIVSHSHHLRK